MTAVLVADFTWSDGPEPHALRRRAMMQQHPQIKTLFGPCPRTKYVCIALVGLQLVAAYFLRHASWWSIFVVAYVFGGVANHALLLAIHELAHNLVFKRPVMNRLFGLVINLPVGLPVAATFKRYHLLHHAYQGQDGVDTDLPTALEGRWLRTRLAKAAWMAAQGLFYALRPLLVLPRRPNGWEVANFVTQFTFNAAVVYFWGLKAYAYFPLGSVIVMGFHPVAGHYLSEHYVFAPDQETYSYYGPLNRITFNVGYHNEHHDFPYIPWSRLPLLREMAPEYYDTLTSHRSWTKVIWRYVTDGTLGGFSRVKRRPATVVAEPE